MSAEFATVWRTYELEEKTRALLEYAEALTKAPAAVGDADIDALRDAGRSEDAIYDATALIAFFNFSGRMEAASGLPPDDVPIGSRMREARGEAVSHRVN